MSGHLYKNFHILRSSLIFLGVMQLIFSGVIIALTALTAAAPNGDFGPLVLVCPLCYFLEFLLVGLATGDMFQKDERPAWVAFSASTPSGARGQVLAKYYMLLIIYVVISVLCFLTDVAVSLISKGESSSSVVIVIIFSVILFIQAFEMPFYFRCGMNKGIAIKGAALGVVVLLIVVYFLFGDISFLIDTDDPIAAFTEWVSGDVPLMIFALLPYVSVAAYFLSSRISQKIYRKGAENYGQ